MFGLYHSLHCMHMLMFVHMEFCWYCVRVENNFDLVTSCTITLLTPYFSDSQNTCLSYLQFHQNLMGVKSLEIISVTDTQLFWPTVSGMECTHLHVNTDWEV